MPFKDQAYQSDPLVDGLQAYERGDYRRAENDLSRGLEKLERRGAWSGTKLKEALHALANIFRNGDKFVEANSLYLRAIAAENQINSNSLPLLRLLSDYSVNLVMQSRFSEAYLIEKRRLRIADESTSTESDELLSCIATLCALSRIRFDYKSAEQYYLRLLHHLEETTDDNEDMQLSVLIDIATIWFRQHKYPQSEAMYRSALQFLNTSGKQNLTEKANLFNSIGLSLCAQGRQHDAKQLCNKAAAIRLNFPEITDSPINDLADHFCSQECYGVAQNLCEDASYAREIENSVATTSLGSALEMYVTNLRRLNCTAHIEILQGRIQRLEEERRTTTIQ
jgi:hypothetical protein